VAAMTVRRVVVDHVLFVVEDLSASRRLSTAALAPLGSIELHVQEDGVHDGAEGLDDFSMYGGAPVTSGAHMPFELATAVLSTRSSTPRSKAAPRLEPHRASGRGIPRATTRHP
jgi:hypothetical protein